MPLVPADCSQPACRTLSKLEVILHYGQFPLTAHVVELGETMQLAACCEDISAPKKEGVDHGKSACKEARCRGSVALHSCNLFSQNQLTRRAFHTKPTLLDRQDRKSATGASLLISFGCENGANTHANRASQNTRNVSQQPCFACPITGQCCSLTRTCVQLTSGTTQICHFPEVLFRSQTSSHIIESHIQVGHNFLDPYKLTVPAGCSSISFLSY